MQWPHWSFAARLLLGLCIAVALIAVLALLTARPAEVAAAAPGDPAPPAAAALPPLPRGRGPLLLCAAAGDVPAAAFLVLQIGADGSVRMLREPPILVLPSPLPFLASTATPAIVLPTGDLAGLSPAVRGSLLECLSALLGERPVLPRSLRFQGVRAAPEEISRLLSWVR